MSMLVFGFHCSINSRMKRPHTETETSEDYYIENGLMVFTASFLLKRGYCCQRGCRHCPFREDQKKVKKKKLG
jgi:hypothetical protein